MHLERGDADAALSELRLLGHEPRGSVVDADLAGLQGLALLQGARVDEAIAVVEPAYAAAENDGARTALGGLLALIHVARRDPSAALDVGREVARLRGGTYMDRLLLHWATGYAFAQQGAATDAVAALDEAHAIAFATDARVDRAIASLARATAFEHLGIGAAHEARNEANLQLHSLGIDAAGWDLLFRRALSTEAVR